MFDLIKSPVYILHLKETSDIYRFYVKLNRGVRSLTSCNVSIVSNNYEINLFSDKRNFEDVHLFENAIPEYNLKVNPLGDAILKKNNINDCDSKYNIKWNIFQSSIRSLGNMISTKKYGDVYYSKDNNFIYISSAGKMYKYDRLDNFLIISMSEKYKTFIQINPNIESKIIYLK